MNHRTPASLCPYCGGALTGATATKGDPKPAPGDYSVCIYCAGILQFDDDLHLVTCALGNVDAEQRADVAEARAKVIAYNLKHPLRSPTKQ